VMIRPRGGDFLYTKEELEIMKHDAIAAVQAGADGIVVGILNSDGAIDVENCRKIIVSASTEYEKIHHKKAITSYQKDLHNFHKRLGITFHRAFDRADVFSDLSGAQLCSNKLQQRLMEVSETGAERILTSGFLQTVNEGMANIAEIVSAVSPQVPRQLKIMAGSGVNATNAKSLIESGVDALHLTAKSYKPGNMIHHALHFTEKEENELMFADSAKIEAIMQIVMKHNNK
jgi:copper homeostasis protein